MDQLKVFVPAFDNDGSLIGQTLWKIAIQYVSLAQV